MNRIPIVVPEWMMSWGAKDAFLVEDEVPIPPFSSEMLALSMLLFILLFMIGTAVSLYWQSDEVHRHLAAIGSHHLLLHEQIFVG